MTSPTTDDDLAALEDRVRGHLARMPLLNLLVGFLDSMGTSAH